MSYVAPIPRAKRMFYEKPPSRFYGGYVEVEAPKNSLNLLFSVDGKAGVFELYNSPGYGTTLSAIEVDGERINFGDQWYSRVVSGVSDFSEGVLGLHTIGFSRSLKIYTRYGDSNLFRGNYRVRLL